MPLALLLLVIAEFQHGAVAVLERPSPGFGGGLPHFVQVNAYDSDLKFQRTMGVYPSVAAPSTIVFAPDGDLWVAESVGFVHFDASGTRLGVSAYYSSMPAAVAFDYGDLIIAGGGTCDIARLDSDGHQVACINEPRLNPILDLDIDADGCHALISHLTGLDTIDLCSKDAHAIPFPGAPVDVYRGARFLPDGDILVTHGVSAYGAVKIDLFDRRGLIIRRLYDALGAPTVTLDPDGQSFCVVDDAAMYRIAIKGDTVIAGPSRLVHGIAAPAISVRNEWRAATARNRRRAVSH